MDKEELKEILYDIILCGTIVLLILMLVFGARASEQNSCLYILNKLTPKQSINILKNTTANAYITLQKDIIGQTTLTSPVHAGIKINIPLLDKKEQLQVLKENLRNIQYAYKIVSQYLTLKTKIEEQQKYINWQWQRVKAGIEYKKDIWQKQIKYKEDLAKLKALEIFFKAIGISKQTLENCYKDIFKID